MANFTPVVKMSLGEGCDVESVSKNLFKNVPVPAPPEEKLSAFLRLRPVDGYDRLPFRILDAQTLLAIPPASSKAFKSANNKQQAADPRKYTFSHIFDPTVGQYDFFNACAQPLVTKFLRGDNTLLFAYGTTSSGKSYTMQGNSLNPGVIPRSLTTVFKCLGDRIETTPIFRPARFNEAQRIFDSSIIELETSIREYISSTVLSQKSSADSLKNFSSMTVDMSDEIREESNILHPDNIGMRYNVWVSFVEFYKNEVNDLLTVKTGDQPTPPLMLISDGRNYFFKGIRHVFVSTPEEAMQALIYGQHNLHVASTKLNERSSRSHCCFIVTLIAFDIHSERFERTSNLAFCDLAGSERGDRTQNMGERIREAGKINSSLSVLGRCITAIRTNQRRGPNVNQMVVPFRECKLTQMFQSYFNGSASAAFVVNINPSEPFFDETLFSLDFSAIASKIVTNSEENRQRIQESFNRLTQMWMQSTQRWSTFAQHRPPKPSMSTIMGTTTAECILEESEEEADRAGATPLDITLNDIERAKTTLLVMNEQNISNEAMQDFVKQFEEMSERLQQAQEEKIEIEMKVRAEVANEMKQMMDKLAYDHADEANQQRKNFETQLEKRSLMLKNQYKNDKDKWQSEKHELEMQLFDLQEKSLKVEESHNREVEKLREEIESLRKGIVPNVSKVDSSMNTSIAAPTPKMVDRRTSTAQVAQKSQKVQTEAAVYEDKAIVTDPVELYDEGREQALGRSIAELTKSLNQMEKEKLQAQDELKKQQEISDLKEKLNQTLERANTESEEAFKRLQQSYSSSQKEIEALKSKCDRLTAELLQSKKENKGTLYNLNDSNPLAELRKPTKVQVNEEPDDYVKLMAMEEAKSSKKPKKRAAAKSLDSEDDDEEAHNSDEDFITKIGLKSQRKSKRTRAKQQTSIEDDKPKRQRKNGSDCARKKIIKDESMLSAGTPIQEADLSQDIISHTGRKLRTRKKNKPDESTQGNLKKKLF